MRNMIYHFLIYFLMIGCSQNNDRINLDNYSTGKSLDNNWDLIRAWEEDNRKLLIHSNDSNLTCRVIGSDSIIYQLSKGRVNENEIQNFRNYVTDLLGKQPDSSYREKVVNKLTLYSFHWYDSVHHDNIFMFKSRQTYPDTSTWSWSIEISNDTIY